MFNKKKQPAIRSLISDGTRISGPILFTDGLRVDGTVVGTIQGNEERSSILVISETATVTGEVFADHVIINGTVKGPVHARLMLELQPLGNAPRRHH
jgi:cytoskeletal protein CcmA (bactofilin family)